tara:strand:+ start:501 stop:1091 length:591 start_codon:yes stop_codon:yes gene_type:complete
MFSFENYKKNLFSVMNGVNNRDINFIVEELSKLKKRKGRLIILGVGGSAGNSSHAVNDFRKLCGIDTYAPTDNISEITARTNDEGWDTIFEEWLKISNIKKKDLILIFSVGGGNKSKKISVNLIKAINYAKKNSIKIISILGKKDGYAAKHSKVRIAIENDLNDKNLLTPISESIQTVLWHFLVSHPKLQEKKTKW